MRRSLAENTSLLIHGVVWVLRLGFAALFAYAGWGKLADPSAFALEIANYQIAPELAPAVAIVLPAVEIVVALVLVFAPRLWRQAAALCAAGMSVVFLFAVTSAWVRDVNIDCGCFGGGGSAITGLTVLRNCGLVAVALILLIWDRKVRRR